MSVLSGNVQWVRRKAKRDEMGGVCVLRGKAAVTMVVRKKETETPATYCCANSYPRVRIAPQADPLNARGVRVQWGAQDSLSPPSSEPIPFYVVYCSICSA